MTTRLLEAQPLIHDFLSSQHALRTTRLREVVGVVVRMVVERLGWKMTGKSTSLGVRVTVPPGMATLLCPEDQYRIPDECFRGRLSFRSKTMNSFCVWLHPLANGCKVRVLGIENAKWLLNRLKQSFVVKSSEAVNEEECYPRCSFRMLYSFLTPRSSFEKLLGAIPEVKLMLDLA